MGLSQEIRPVNTELMDTLVEASKMDWMQYVEGEDRAFVKNFTPAQKVEAGQYCSDG